jgi:hypothetical protein
MAAGAKGRSQRGGEEERGDEVKESERGKEALLCQPEAALPRALGLCGAVSSLVGTNDSAEADRISLNMEYFGSSYCVSVQGEPAIFRYGFSMLNNVFTKMSNLPPNLRWNPY